MLREKPKKREGLHLKEAKGGRWKKKPVEKDWNGRKGHAPGGS